MQLAEEFARLYIKGIVPQFAEERLIQSLQDMPQNSGLPFISKLIIGDANKKWKKEQHQVSYEEYIYFERDYIRNRNILREITTVDEREIEKIRLLCKQHGISINDYLIAKMMKEDDTNKVVIAAATEKNAGTGLLFIYGARTH